MQTEAPKWIETALVDPLYAASRGNVSELSAAFTWADTPEGVAYWNAQFEQAKPLDTKRLREMLREYQAAKAGPHIVTNYWKKPIPDRNHDWVASEIGYDAGDPVGFGPTREAAVADVLEQLSEREV